MDMTQAKGEYVVLSEEADIMRAQWLAGAIEGAGIPTYVESDDLMDEFSMFQKVLGAPRVRILVPGDRLAEARTVFLNLSQPIPLIDEDDEAEDEDDLELKAMAKSWRSRVSSRAVLIMLVLWLVPGTALLIQYLLGL